MTSYGYPGYPGTGIAAIPTFKNTLYLDPARNCLRNCWYPGTRVLVITPEYCRSRCTGTCLGIPSHGQVSFKLLFSCSGPLYQRIHQHWSKRGTTSCTKKKPLQQVLPCGALWYKPTRPTWQRAGSVGIPRRRGGQGVDGTMGKENGSGFQFCTGAGSEKAGGWY
eukprot:3297374-Rhodomonas_salina.1